MAIEIGSLVVELSANVARLSADMNKATGIVSGSMKNMSDSIQGISNRMNLIVGSQVFQSLDLLARRGMEAFSAIKHSAIDAADELNKLSQKTGFSTESLSGLKYAAELSDLSLEGMTKSLKSLSVNMVEAKGGSKEMAGIFKQLGVSMDDPEAALLQLAEQFQQMPDGAQKAALAVKLFGKEGLTMIPFLNQGRDGIAELTAEAQRFGLVIDSETARQAEAFNDNLTRLKANVGGLVQQLGMSMLPMLMSLSESLLSAKTAVGGFDDNVRQIVGRRAGVEGFVESFARGMAHLYNMIMPVIVIGRQLYDVLKGIAIEGAGWAAQIGALASGNISGFRAIREAVSRDAEQLRKDSDAFIARISSSAQGAAGNVTKFFDEHRRTVRSGSQKYLMASEQDARLLQTAIDKAYKGAGRSVKDFDSVLSASSNNSKKVADEAAQRLASIKNADLDLDFAKVAAETEAIYARSQVLVKLQQHAIDAYADSLNEAAFAAADLQIKFNGMVDANAQAMTETAQSTVASLGEEIEGLRLRNEEIGLTAEQLALLTQTRLDATIASKEQLYADTALTEQNADYLAALAEQIKLLREKKGLLGQGAARQLIADEARTAQDEWKRAADDIEKSLTDALMRGFEGGKDIGRNFVDTIKNYLKAAFLKPISVQISTTLLGAVGMGGTAQAGGIAGGSSSTIGVAGGLKALYDSVAGGFAALGNSVAFATEAAGNWLVTNTTGALNSAGSSLMANSGAVGSAASALGGAAAGFVLGKMISGGYSVIGKSGNTAVALGTAIGSIWGPIGSVIGGAIGGLVNRAFGMGAKKSTGDGISGTFAGEDFSGSEWATWKQKGGWFRSDKSGIDTGPLSNQATRAMSDEFAWLKRATTDYAHAMGLQTDKIVAYTKSINVSLTGLDEAGRQAKFTEVFAEMANDMANLALGTVKYTRAGESSAQTLERLVVHLTAVNATMASLSRNAFSASLSGADMANQLADLAGGMQAFIDLSAGYYQNFYSEGERFTAAVAGMRDSLINIGVKTMPTTIAAFRQLMEAQDLTTLSGRATYAALLNVSAGFAELVNNISGQLHELEAEQLKLAQEILDERNNLEKQMFALLGDEAALRERELASIDPLNRALFLHVQALSDAKTANEAYTDQLNALASAGQGVASFIRELRADLTSPGSTLNSLRSAYNADLSRAKLGDFDASNAIADSAKEYLDAVRNQAKSRTEYDIAATRIANELEKLPATESYAKQQLAALQNLHTQANSLDALDAARQEAAKRVLGNVDANTVDLSTQTDRQIDQLRQLVGESITNSARILQLNSSMDALKNAIVAMTAAEKTKADIANGNMLLKALTEQQAGAIAGVNAGIDRIWQLQSLYGSGQYINAKAGPLDYSNSAQFAVVDGLYSQQYGQHSYATMTGYNNISAFKAAYAAEKLSDKTLGQASTLKDLKDQIEAQRSAIRALGGIPQFAVGTNWVPRDMTARIHEGERIIPAADNSELMRRLSSPRENNTALLAELKALRAEVVQLRAETRATAQHTGKAARLLDRAMPDGDALSVRATT